MLAEAAEIIPRVSGNVTVDITTVNATTNNKTYHGHLAPEGGLALINSKVMIQNATNWVLRYLTIRDGATAVLSTDDALFLNRPNKIALDHLSLGWGGDEALDIYTGNTGAGGTYSDLIFQRSIFGQQRTGHNTGCLIGYTGGTGNGEPLVTGQLNFWATWARTPNFAGDTGAYGRFSNDVAYGWVGRTSNIVRKPNVDIYNNYYKASTDTLTLDVSMMNQYQDEGLGNPSIYSAGNYVEGYLTDLEADNTGAGGIWSYFDNYNSTLLPSGWFRGSPLSIDANVGYNPLTALDTYSTIVTDKEVGNNRSTDSNGSPVVGLDSVDEAYFTAFNSGASTIVAEGSWSHPTIASNTAYPDTNLNGIDDDFETTHSITSSSQVITNWTFGDITVVNNAGYTAFEMWSAYAAGDFERLSTIGNTFYTLTETQKGRNKHNIRKFVKRNM